MAISNKEYGKIAMFGGIAGVATPFILKYAALPILSALAKVIPGVSAKLAESTPTISISVTNSLTGINGGLSNWLVNAIGITASIPFETYIMGAIGGALIFMLGAWVADLTGMLKGNAAEKTRAVIFSGSLAAAFILGGFAVPAIGLGMLDTLIAFMINAAILAWIYVTIDDKAKLGLIPF